MGNLLIVESPAKIKTLKKILGDDWEIAASFGHVRDLPRNEIAIDPPDFKPKYEIIDRAKTTVAKLKKLAASADSVYLGTDPDREGEAIAWHLSRVLNVKAAQRVRFNEITATAVRTAVNAATVIDINKVAAQETRRALDRLVGYMVSPVVTRALASSDPLSAGRVQSVALRLVVERERAIRDFQSVDHYAVQVRFLDEATEVSWPAHWDFSPLLGESQGNDDEGTDESGEQRSLWVDRPVAETLVQALSQPAGFTVLEVQQKPHRRRPPAPFTTSTMQQAASAKLHLSPERTMELAQKLYEAGIITYHRTDNCNLSDDGIAAIREWITGRMGNDSLLANPPNHWKNKEGAQEGHEATRPTDFNRTKLTVEEAATHSDDAAALYQLIWQRAVASQMLDAVYDATKVVLRSDALLNGEQQRFVAKGRVLVEEGWMRLTKTDATDEGNESPNENDQALPELTVGLYLEHTGAELKAKKTQAPPRYTEAALVKHLEKEGVGRPSTYAAILKNITSRGYIEVKSRKIRATELGEHIIGVLVGAFQFAEVKFTRSVESVLDRIATGEFGYSAVVAKYYERLTAELGSMPPPPPKPGAEDLGYVCPKCGRPILRRKAKKSSRHFWGCSGYPECDVTLPDTKDQLGDPAPDFDALDRPKPTATDIMCPKCGKGHLVRREGSRGAFYGCNKYPKCKATFEEQDGGPLIKEQEVIE